MGKTREDKCDFFFQGTFSISPTKPSNRLVFSIACSQCHLTSYNMQQKYSFLTVKERLVLYTTFWIQQKAGNERLKLGPTGTSLSSLEAFPCRKWEVFFSLLMNSLKTQWKCNVRWMITCFFLADFGIKNIIIDRHFFFQNTILKYCFWC